jgi:hypothetical protein
VSPLVEAPCPPVAVRKRRLVEVVEVVEVVEHVDAETCRSGVTKGEDLRKWGNAGRPLPASTPHGGVPTKHAVDRDIVSTCPRALLFHCDEPLYGGSAPVRRLTACNALWRAGRALPRTGSLRKCARRPHGLRL